MSRMENTDIPVSNKGVHSGQGESGIIGGTGEGVNAHDICQSKALDYRWQDNRRPDFNLNLSWIYNFNIPLLYFWHKIAQIVYALHV